MGRKDIEEKTPEELQAERVTAALDETDRTGHVPNFVRENPGQFLRDMYEVWHRQGGKEGGRWRNSIRKMREEWLIGRNAVPSLHQKLMGRVKLTRSNVRSLLGLFLELWRYEEISGRRKQNANEGYVRFPALSLSNLKRSILDALMDSLNTLALPAQRTHSLNQLNDPRVRTFSQDEYNKCDALITFSRNRIAIGRNPAQTIMDFTKILNILYQEEKNSKNSHCMLIWVVDMGTRYLENSDSFEYFYNSCFLSLLFKAFLSFDSKVEISKSMIGDEFREPDFPQREQRLKWLEKRSAIVVSNLRRDEKKQIYKDEIHKNDHEYPYGDFTNLHILPQDIPETWNESIHKIFKKRVEYKDMSFTSLFKCSGWDSEEKFKHFAHTDSLRKLENEHGFFIDSVQLPSAGENYEKALEYVYYAVSHRIRKKGIEIEEYAFNKIRQLGFSILDIDEFLKIM